MRALVVGAGIAGPTVAYFLVRRGFEVTVVERALAPRPGGYAVDVRGVALDVIGRMGLREVLRPLETDTLSNSMVDAEGRRFGTMARGFGVVDPEDVEILRGDLATVLHEATRNDVRYVFGESITALRSHDDGVEVTFGSGREERFVLVVGADGVHSRTRALAFGPEEELVHGLGSAMTIFTAPNHLGLRREQLMYGEPKRLVSVKCAANDRDLRVFLFFEASRETFDPSDVAAQKRVTAAAFAGSGWEVPRLLAAMERADDFYADLTCQVRMEPFHRGRVVLVGDAGYCPSPMSGQGTSLALVGAYVLAHELGEARDPLVAFPRYEARVRDFVVRNQDLAKKLAGGFAPRSPFELWTRNLFFRVLPWVPGSGKIMSYAMRDVRVAAHAMTLPA